MATWAGLEMLNHRFIIMVMPIVMLYVSSIFVMAFFKLYHFSKKGHSIPVSGLMLRSPGESLRKTVEEHNGKLMEYLIVLIITPAVLCYPLFLLLQRFIKNYMVIALLLFIIFIFFMIIVWRLINRRNSSRLALDCEMAVGQELNQLMLDGYRVYHDFPAEEFNIDHVVAGPKGVFAVETKGRSKRDAKRGSAGATVIFDGQKLHFPGWSEREPIEQSKRQAAWLSGWLSSAVGEPVSVKPVLALPGWFVDLRKPGEVLVFDGKNPHLLLRWGNDHPLSESAIKRIAHQLDQRCRNIEPAAYSK
ncbi:MAG: nuclease-related domain-containing protein [bacterium]